MSFGPLAFLTTPSGMTLLTDLGFGLLLLLLLRLTRPAYLAFKRRRSGFGIVFDSVTGLPIDRGAVSLRDLHGQLVRTVVSEKDGRYRLMAPKGEYYVEVSKAGYTFPSELFKNKTSSSIYENLLPGNHIVIKDYGAITKNIAIDPVAAKDQRSAFTRNIALPKAVQNLIAWLSPLLALGIAYLEPYSWAIWSMYALYIAIMIGRLFSFKPPQPPFGTIRDAQTGEPIQGVVVRILQSKYNKLLETQTTSPKGRYAFIVGRGAFRVLMTKRGYKGVILNFPLIREDRFLIAKDVRMKMIPTRITPLAQTMRGTLEEMPEGDAHRGVGDLT